MHNKETLLDIIFERRAVVQRNGDIDEYFSLILRNAGADVYNFVDDQQKISFCVTDSQCEYRTAYDSGEDSTWYTTDEGQDKFRLWKIPQTPLLPGAARSFGAHLFRKGRLVPHEREIHFGDPFLFEPPDFKNIRHETYRAIVVFPERDGNWELSTPMVSDEITSRSVAWDLPRQTGATRQLSVIGRTPATNQAVLLYDDIIAELHVFLGREMCAHPLDSTNLLRKIKLIADSPVREIVDPLLFVDTLDWISRRNLVERVLVELNQLRTSFANSVAGTLGVHNIANVDHSQQRKMTVARNLEALLVTAVSSERTALLEVLREDFNLVPTLEEIGGRYFNRFAWPGRDRIWNVLVGQSTEKGGAAAQALLQSVVKSQPPAVVLMVGMCGGLPENGAKEGMVILGRQVFNYEPARVREGTFAWSPTAYRSTAKILDLANALIATGEFGSVEVKTTKDYASGAKLIDDLSSDLRQRIIALSGDVLAFEMEAPDLLHAVWELERTVRFDVAVAKGISDFGDGNQRDDKEARQRTATRNATHVALKLLAAY